MRKFAAFLVTLFLVIGSSFIGNSNLKAGEKANCLESQFEVQIGNEGITCINNVDIKVNL